jgi:phosphoribosyl 1,2-cyclic phosphodiesterase
MHFSVLSSGSKANSTLVVSAAGDPYLVDCGLSAKECYRRALDLGVKIDDLRGIFVTHAHADHVRGLPSLLRRKSVPVFASNGTAQALSLPRWVQEFQAGDCIAVDGLCVESFSIPHDDVDPVGFKISSGGVSLLHLTDVGRITPLVLGSIGRVDAMVLEFNHDRDMLMACHYPWSLKQRISSHFGHLSNVDAEDFLMQIDSSALQTLVLAHISDNSNTKELAYQSAVKALGDIGIRSEVGVEVGTVKHSTPMMAIRERRVVEIAGFNLSST